MPRYAKQRAAAAADKRKSSAKSNTVTKRTAADVAKGKAHMKVSSSGGTRAPSQKVVTGQTFSQAFASARKEKGPGKTFTYQGKSYSTNTKEDMTKAKSPSASTTAKAPAARATTKRASVVADMQAKDRAAAKPTKRSTSGQMGRTKRYT